MVKKGLTAILVLVVLLLSSLSFVIAADEDDRFFTDRRSAYSSRTTVQNDNSYNARTTTQTLTTSQESRNIALCQQLGCYDTDGGPDTSERGTVYYQDGRACYDLTDECIYQRGAWYVREYQCTDDPGTAIDTIFPGGKGTLVKCELGCVDGACIQPTCNDGIQNQNEIGIDCGGVCGECTNLQLAEVSCLETGCYDSDKFQDPMQAGYLVYRKQKSNGENYCSEPVQDSCKQFPDGRWMVTQHFCEELEVPGQSFDDFTVQSTNEFCEGLCEFGACLPPTCDDGIKNQNEEQIDCGGVCGACIDTSCVDDFGVTEFTKDYVTIEDLNGNPLEVYDECLPDLTQVEESICIDGSLDSQIIDCQFGCYDGACSDKSLALCSDGSLASWQLLEEEIPHSLREVFILPDDTTYIVGSDGSVLQTDGNCWEEMNLGGKYTLSSVWGTSQNNVYISGFDNSGFSELDPNSDGVIFHYDGSKWTKVVELPHPIIDLFGFSSDNIYAVAYSGKLLHYDGSVWTITDLGVSVDFTEIWGTSSTNLYLGSDFYSQGKVFHYDQTTLEEITELPSKGRIAEIAGTDENNVYVLHNYDTISHFDGTSWSQVYGGGASNSFLFDLEIVNNDNIYASGFSRLLQSSSSNNFNIMTDEIFHYINLLSIAGDSNDHVYMIGTATKNGIQSGKILEYSCAEPIPLCEPLNSCPVLLGFEPVDIEFESSKIVDIEYTHADQNQGVSCQIYVNDIPAQQSPLVEWVKDEFGNIDYNGCDQIKLIGSQIGEHEVRIEMTDSICEVLSINHFTVNGPVCQDSPIGFDTSVKDYVSIPDDNNEFQPLYDVCVNEVGEPVMYSLDVQEQVCDASGYYPVVETCSGNTVCLDGRCVDDCIKLYDEDVMPFLTENPFNEIDPTRPLLGDPNAPNTFIAFLSLEGPYVHRWYEHTFPFIKTYFIDTGKINFQIRDFAFSFHPNSKQISIAALCAGEQGKYYEYIDRVLTIGQAETQIPSEMSTPGALLGYAIELGLDEQAFTICTQDPAIAQKVDDDFALGQQIGVTGTPSFFIYNFKIEGAQPLETFDKVIRFTLGECLEAIGCVDTDWNNAENEKGLTQGYLPNQVFSSESDSCTTQNGVVGVLEYMCANNEQVSDFMVPVPDFVPCDYGCEDGVCLEKPFCEESELGFAPFDKDSIMAHDANGEIADYYDVCIDEFGSTVLDDVMTLKLMEWVCSEQGQEQSFVDCPCLNGACICVEGDNGDIYDYDETVGVISDEFLGLLGDVEIPVYDNGYVALGDFCVNQPTLEGLNLAEIDTSSGEYVVETMCGDDIHIALAQPQKCPNGYTCNSGACVEDMTAANICSWKEMDIETNVELFGIYGNDSNQIFAVGGDLAQKKSEVFSLENGVWVKDAIFDDLVMKDIWVSPDGVAFAVTDEGILLKRDNTNWVEIATGLDNYLSAIYGFTSDDVYFVSGGPSSNSAGSVYHYDGSTVSQIYVNNKLILSGIWGTSNENIYVVGKDQELNKAVVLHYDGNTWEKEFMNNLNVVLGSVWGSSVSDIYVAGGYFEAYHYNGLDWNKIEEIANYALAFLTIWGSGSDDVWIAGMNQAYHYDGNTWEKLSDLLGTSYITDIWGTSNENIYAVGKDKIIHYTCEEEQENQCWVPIEGLPAMDDMIPAPSGDGIIMLNNNKIYAYDANNWGEVHTLQENKNSLFSPSGTNQIYAYSTLSPTIEYWDGQWNTMTVPQLAENDKSISSLWGSAPNDLYAVPEGYMFPPGIFHYDGDSWELINFVDLFSGPPYSSLSEVSGTNSNNIFARGYEKIFHYDGIKWSVKDLPGFQIAQIEALSSGKLLINAKDLSIEPSTFQLFTYDFDTEQLVQLTHTSESVRDFHVGTETEIYFSTEDSKTFIFNDGFIYDVPNPFVENTGWVTPLIGGGGSMIVSANALISNADHIFLYQGNCNEEPIAIDSCLDPDGEDITKATTVTGTIEGFEYSLQDECRVFNAQTNQYNGVDSCQGENCFVGEMQCSQNGQGFGDNYPCPQGCSNGACSMGGTETCEVEEIQLGDAVLLGNYDHYYGLSINNVESASLINIESLTDAELPTILYEGSFTDTKGNNENSIGYTQELEFPDRSTGRFVFDQHDLDAPKAGSYLWINDSNANQFTTYPQSLSAAYNSIYNPFIVYRVEFDSPVNYDSSSEQSAAQDLEGAEISLLGENYYISDVKSQSTNGAYLIDEVQMMTGKVDEWLVFGDDYWPPSAKQEISYVRGEDGACIEHTIKVLDVVPADSTSSSGLCGLLVDETVVWIEVGEVKTTNGLTIGVLAAELNSQVQGVGMCHIIVDAEKVILTDGEEVENNNDHLDGTYVRLRASQIATPGKWDGFEISWGPSKEEFIDYSHFAPPLLKPGYNEIPSSLEYADFVIDPYIYVGEREEISIVGGSTSGEIVFTNNGGHEVTLPLSADQDCYEINGAACDNEDYSEPVFWGTDAPTQVNQNLDEQLYLEGEMCDATKEGSDVTACENSFFLVISSQNRATLVQVGNIDIWDQEIDFYDVTYGTKKNDVPFTFNQVNTINLGAGLSVKLLITSDSITFVETGASDGNYMETQHGAKIYLHNTDKQSQRFEGISFEEFQSGETYPDGTGMIYLTEDEFKLTAIYDDSDDNSIEILQSYLTGDWKYGTLSLQTDGQGWLDSSSTNDDFQEFMTWKGTHIVYDDENKKSVSIDHGKQATHAQFNLYPVE